MARTCVISRLLSHYASKSVKESDFYACLRKKIKIKTITKRYISHIYPDIPREWIVTTFGICGGPVDLINYTNFWQSIQGFRFCMGQNSTIPIDFAVNTVLLRRTACDQSRQFFALC